MRRMQEEFDGTDLLRSAMLQQHLQRRSTKENNLYVIPSSAPATLCGNGMRDRRLWIQAFKKTFRRQICKEEEEGADKINMFYPRPTVISMLFRIRLSPSGEHVAITGSFAVTNA